jgi:hypothetical protein
VTRLKVLCAISGGAVQRGVIKYTGKLEKSYLSPRWMGD